IDIPSGMFCEDNPIENQNIVHADFTLTFQFTKLSFLLPEAGSRVGEWQLLDIELNTNAIEGTLSEYFFTDKNFIQNKIKSRA
ncbi:bifunctional ADP-dependent NAD(P)H-hydrate dehydratase/NAD(P)H-hydrate epimerase, partial [bacterium]|nr:bifunctional ADP-dependent NAD(P)H-hydrate dehydratase/NAD(P)H-hydrate epimerase [bacterium]